MLHNNLIKLEDYPVISTAKEYELAVLYYKTKDIEAAKKLTMGHLKFVAHISYKYNHFGFSQADLFQEGCIGLMKAIKNFNPYKGVKLITFASYWIKAEIHEFILKNWHIVKIATTKAQRKLFFGLNNQLEKLKQANKEINYQKIAKDLGVKEKDVKEMESRLSNPSMQLEDYSKQSENENNNYCQANTDPAEIFAHQYDSDSKKQILTKALKNLDQRSLHIIKKRWLDEQKTPLRELSDQYGVSMERIRQIEGEAFAKMRSYLPSQTNSKTNPI